MKTMYDDVPVQFRRDLTQEEVDFIAERLLAVIESFPVKPRYRGSPKWGVRRYQDVNGLLTEEGKKRYREGSI